jgi:hypothetical protein
MSGHLNLIFGHVSLIVLIGRCTLRTYVVVYYIIMVIITLLNQILDKCVLRTPLSGRMKYGVTLDCRVQISII